MLTQKGRRAARKAARLRIRTSSSRGRFRNGPRGDRCTVWAQGPESQGLSFKENLCGPFKGGNKARDGKVIPNDPPRLNGKPGWLPEKTYRLRAAQDSGSATSKLGSKNVKATVRCQVSAALKRIGGAPSGIFESQTTEQKPPETLSANQARENRSEEGELAAEQLRHEPPWRSADSQTWRASAPPPPSRHLGRASQRGPLVP